MNNRKIHLRDDHSQCANLYSLIYSLEHLERSYVSGHSYAEEYEEECKNLLSLCMLMEESTPEIFEYFEKEFDLNFPLALNRIRVGFPATLQRVKKPGKETKELMIFDLSGYFITLMDALKLKTNSVGELFPLLHVLIDSIEKIDPCRKQDPKNLWNLEFLDRLMNWYLLLQRMKASEELDEDNLTQFMMDTESAYNSYRDHLKTH